MDDLKNFIRKNEGDVFRVTFVDGEELELKLLHWFQDIGEKPRAHATVVTASGKWKSDSAIVYDLDDVRRILDTKTNVIVFQTEE